MSSTKLALTLRKTRDPVFLSDYEAYFIRLRLKGYVIDNINYEDSKGLHVHCVLSHPRQDVIYANVKLEAHGWSVRLKRIYNMKGWLHYLTKSDTNRIYAKHKALEQEFIDYFHNKT